MRWRQFARHLGVFASRHATCHSVHYQNNQHGVEERHASGTYPQTAVAWASHLARSIRPLARGLSDWPGPPHPPAPRTLRLHARCTPWEVEAAVSDGQHLITRE